MFSFFENRYSLEDIADHTGDISQIAGIRRYTLQGSTTSGVEVIDVRTGSGLSYSVLGSRACDLAWAEYKGIPLVFISPTGFVHPHYYEPYGNDWLRSFGGGLLTTCGLSHVGQPSAYEGIEYGLHGRISNQPAENLATRSFLDGDEFILEVEGESKQVKSFVEHVTLHRRIRSYGGRSVIEIEDHIENRGSRRQPLMLLYHMNFGFPLVNARAGIAIPGADSSTQYDRFETATDDAGDSFFSFDSVEQSDGMASVLITNDRYDPRLGVRICYSPMVLKHVHLWKNFRSREYVVSIEPANCMVEGLNAAAESGRLAYLEPQEIVKTWMQIEIIENTETIESYYHILRPDS